MMKKTITWFIDNPVISNLLMILIFITGFITISNIKMEVFPSLELDVVAISTVYPGAAPEDVEKSICIPIEESIFGISGIKNISSSSSEGYGVVIAQIISGEDTDAIKDKIKTSVESLKNLPSDSEKPVTAKIERNNPVLTLAVSGKIDELSLNNIIDEIKNDLDNIEGISLTDIPIDKEKEISIEVSREILEKHNITIQDIKRCILLNSVEAPVGKLENSLTKNTLRVDQKAYTGVDIGNIKIYSKDDFNKYTFLKDVAKINDDFKDSEITLKFNNKDSNVIRVFRIGNQNALEISDLVENYVKLKQDRLPEGIELKIWNDDSKYLEGRLNLLLKNALIGLILVMFVLSLFLKPKLAFWVSIGIPISFLGALSFFPMLDVSINMLSLFTFILVLGIVVDDAIVVGENFYKYKEKGFSSRDSSIKGAYEISKPVTFAILTTIATFAPMLFLSGNSGKVWKIFPLVVIPILLFSLFESLTILPFHLAHSKNKESKIRLFRKISGLFKAIRNKVNKYLNEVIENYYKPFLNICLKNNWTTLSSFASIFIITVGLIYSGYVKFNFFPGVESDIIYAQVEFPEGTPIGKTRKAAMELEKSLYELEMEYDGVINSNKGYIRNILTVIGSQPTKSETAGRGESRQNSYTSSNLAEISVELSPGETRDIKSSSIAAKWRELTQPIEGIKELKFSSSLFSTGEDINFQFTSDKVSDLSMVVNDFKQILKRYAGVFDISDNDSKGNSEVIIKLLPEARLYNVDISMITTQIRDAFYGDDVMTLQRGKNEVDVVVRYDDFSTNSISDLKAFQIETPFGNMISLKSVCELSTKFGYTSINRVNRKRALSVIASVDPAVSNSNDIVNSIIKNDMPDLMKKYQSVKYSLEGQQKEQFETLNDLATNYMIALFVVFLLLAVPFKSYYQPFIIMSAIPYGIIGAVFGHLLLGMDFSILSMLGIAALSGIVVNDSLVMMDYINRFNEKSNNFVQAAKDAGPVRFRAILLTSITTFMGVLPLIFEKSLQAKFLVPMAVSLGFGVLFSTFVTLILVPTTYVTLTRIKEYLLKK